MLRDNPPYPFFPNGRPGDKVFGGCYSWRFTWADSTYLSIG